MPTLCEMIRRHWSRDGRDTEPDPAQAQERVRSIFVELSDARNRAATASLDDAVADLLDQPNWQECKARLNGEVEKWCRERPQGAGSPSDRDDIALVISGLVQKVREAGYLKSFVEHYGQVASVDPTHRARISGVFTCLQAETLDRSNEWGSANGEAVDFRKLDTHGIEDKLRQDRRIVIIGEPGSGKSTMLRYLAKTCAESDSDTSLLPVFLNLRDYADGRELLIAESAAVSAEDTLQIKLPEGFFEQALHEGRCLVSLDALDEVPQGRQRDRIVKRIEQLAKNHKECVFVITSRQAGYDERPLVDFPQFIRYSVQPMDDDAITEFLEWRFGWGAALAQDIKDTLDGNVNLKSLASNPLQLAMLILVYQADDREGLPLKRSEFYRAVVEKLIADESTAGSSDYRNHKFFDYREGIMTAIAHYLHGARREAIGENVLKREIARLLMNNPELLMMQDQAMREAKAFLELAERRTGLLVGQKAGRNTEFRFLHSTFREYLTARHIYISHYTDEPETLWGEIKGHLSDVQWREVILFLLSSFDDDEEEYCTYLTKKILAAADQRWKERPDLDHRYGNSYELEKNFLAQYYQSLVIDALINQAPMSLKIQDEIISQLVDAQYTQQYDVHDLLRITHIPERLIPELEKVAGNMWDYGSLSVPAARALARLGAHDKAIELLASMVENPEIDDFHRVYAAESLGRLGEGEQAINTLTNLVTDKSIYLGYQISAWGALREIGQTETAREGLTRLVDDPAVDDDWRLKVWQELAKFGDRDRQRSISQTAGIAEDPAVSPRQRSRAANVLYSLGNAEKAVEIMVALVTDLSTSEELHAGWWRYDLRREFVIDVLTAIAKGSSMQWGDPESVFDALKELGAVERLAEVATNNSIGKTSRAMAAISLIDMSFTESARPALEALTEVGKDENESTHFRYNVGCALADLGKTEMAIIVLAAVANDVGLHDSTRIHASKKLHDLGETETAITALTAVANDAEVSHNIRMSAATMLCDLGKTETAITALTAVANDVRFHDSTRVHSAQKLHDLGETETATNALTAVANDVKFHNSTRIFAAQKLHDLGETETAITVLTAVASDDVSNEFDRFKAGEVLVRLGETEIAIAVLTTVARDGGYNSYTRIEAGEVLARLGEMATAISALTTVASDDEAYGYDRIKAGEMLARFGETEAAVVALYAGVNDINPFYDIHINVAEQLYNLGEKEKAIDLLTAVANSAETIVENRIRAGQVLVEMGETATAITVLTAIASDRESGEYTRASAAEELHNLGETETAITVLTAIANDAVIRSDDRLDAADMLAELGETAPARSALQSISEDQSAPRRIRINATSKLEQLDQNYPNRR